MSATEDGNKELLAVVDGYRESAQSWRELLQQLKCLGLSTAPWPSVTGCLASGSLCRKNMAQSTSNVAGYIKTANILDKMLKSVQGKAN